MFGNKACHPTCAKHIHLFLYGNYIYCIYIPSLLCNKNGSGQWSLEIPCVRKWHVSQPSDGRIQMNMFEHRHLRLVLEVVTIVRCSPRASGTGVLRSLGKHQLKNAGRSVLSMYYIVIVCHSLFLSRLAAWQNVFNPALFPFVSIHWNPCHDHTSLNMATCYCARKVVGK